MNTLIRPLNDVRRTLDIDLVADFTCPWSWLGMAQLTRALGSLSGDVETRLRWHPFRMATKAANTNPRSFHEYLAERLPAGISVPFAEKSLTEAGRELGLELHFEKLGALPSTSEAHRLVQLAVDEGRQANVAAAISARTSRAAPTLANSRCWRVSAAKPVFPTRRCRRFATRARVMRRWWAAKNDCAALASAPCRTCYSVGECWCRARSTWRPTCARRPGVVSVER